jgi:hypothetical protein
MGDEPAEVVDYFYAPSGADPVGVGGGSVGEVVPCRDGRGGGASCAIV